MVVRRPLHHKANPTRQLSTRRRYALQAKSLQIFNFEVKAGCAEGFSGSPSVEVCTAQGEAFKVSGCSKLLVKTCTCLQEDFMEKQKMDRYGANVDRFADLLDFVGLFAMFFVFLPTCQL